MKTEIPAVTAFPKGSVSPRGVADQWQAILASRKQHQGKRAIQIERARIHAAVTDTDTTCDMHQPLEFTSEELQRMDDDRSEREVYRIEDAQDQEREARDE